MTEEIKSIAEDFRGERAEFEYERERREDGLVHKWDDIRDHFADWVRDCYADHYEAMTAEEYSELMAAAIALGAAEV